MGSFMFSENGNFNQDISSWNVEKVENAEAMFQNAKLFNSTLTAWQASALTNVQYMFFGTKSFAQQLCWNVAENVNTENMFYSSAGGCIDPNCCEGCDES